MSFLSRSDSKSPSRVRQTHDSDFTRLQYVDKMPSAVSEYNLHDYGRMIQDRVRTDTYARAIERLVQPDSVVLDIGAGSGMFALLAARAGARRVFAVEPTDMIELARELAAANDCADRITFIQALSTQITLPAPVDVIVSDLHGVLPLFSAHIPSIVDARHRHLAAEGRLIPFREALWAAPAELASGYEDRISSWGAKPYGLDLSAARPFAANTPWWRVAAPADALLAEPARLFVLDYRSISSPNVKSSVECEATRSGTAHGVVVWFDSELAEGAAFTNAPGEPETIYRQAFFPLLEPVDLTPGDTISFEFSASFVDDEYAFRWDTRIKDGSNPTHAKAAFAQSTLFSSPLSPESLARRGEGYAPTPNEDGEAVAFVLGCADGRRTLAELSQDVARRFPERFHSGGETLRFVTELTQKYGR